MKKIVIICFLVMSLSSCGPAIKYTSYGQTQTPTPANQPVKVYEINQELPSGVVVLGELTVGDSALTFPCGYDTMRRKAQEEARKVGGNAIQIISVQNPDIVSSCYRFKVKILAVKSL